MNESRQLTKTCNGEAFSPSPNSREADRARSIIAILNRLALHYPRTNLPEAQMALLMEDMIGDLLPYHPTEILAACDGWRRSDSAFFPKSGQLIALIAKAREASIANARAMRPAFRAPRAIEHQPKKLKPWREILRSHGHKPP